MMSMIAVGAVVVAAYVVFTSLLAGRRGVGQAAPQLIGLVRRGWWLLIWPASVILLPGLVSADPATQALVAAIAPGLALGGLALVTAMSPRLVPKWVLGVGIVVVGYEVLTLLQVGGGMAITQPLPASMMASALLSIALAGWIMWLPAGEPMLRLRDDIQSLTTLYRTSRGGEHGSARWLTDREARAMWGMQASGLVLGAPPRRADRELLVDRTGLHSLVIGGTGSRKTSSFVIPTAIAWQSGLVVFDPKGEVGHVTARARRELGQRVYVVDHRTPQHYVNVLDWLRPDDVDLPEQVAAVAAWLYEESRGDATSAGEFFKASGRSLIEWAVCEVLRTAERPDLATLRRVRQLVALPADQLLQLVRSSQAANLAGVPAPLAALLRDRAGSAPAHFETWSNVVSSVVAQTKWLASERLADCVSGGPEGTDPEQIVRTTAILGGDVTVYLTVAPDVLTSNPAFGRCLVGAFMQPFLRTRSEKRTLFLLDEAPRLGKMEAMSVLLDVGRGYGATLAYVAQSLGQLEQTWGRVGLRNWTENTPMKVILGVGGDAETAEYVSKIAGDTTIYARSASGSGESTGLIKRRLLDVREVLNMPIENALVFARGVPAYRVAKVYYKTHPSFASRCDENPFDRS